MAFITISNVTFVNTPQGNQLVTVAYRRSTDDPNLPESWVTVTQSQLVLVSGEFSPQLVIPNLQDSTSYIVRVTPKCGSSNYYAEFDTPPFYDLSCAGDCCGWTVTNNTSESATVVYIDSVTRNVSRLDVSVDETAYFEAFQIIDLPGGFSIAPSVECTTTSTSTAPPGPKLISGQVSMFCNDHDCDQSSNMIMSFDFDEPIPEDMDIYIGTLTDLGGPPIDPTKRYQYIGSDLFTPDPSWYAADAFREPYGMGENVPFMISVSAGTTKQTNVSPMYPEGQLQSDNYTHRASRGQFQCQRCRYKLVQIWIKIKNPDYKANFTIKPSGHDYTYTQLNNVY